VATLTGGQNALRRQTSWRFQFRKETFLCICLGLCGFGAVRTQGIDFALRPAVPRIVAIEPDSKCRRALTMIVREHVKATLAVVPTVRAAIASIAEQTPDLVTLPMFLSPADEAELLAHMKGLESAPYIQMLTVPVLDMLVDAPAETRRRGVFDRVFRRRTASLGLPCDPGMVAAQIVDALARARELRLEYANTLALEDAMIRRAAQNTSLALAGCDSQQLLLASGAMVEQHLRDRARDERRVALRKGRGDVPWLSGIKLGWGPEVELINISTTGVLIETGSKLAPGTTANLQLCGPENSLVVPARFIRSDIARVDGLGVRYRAAAAFSKELDIVGRGPGLDRDGRIDATPSGELAALFSAVLSSTRDEPAHARFAQGLRELVGASDVRVSAGLSEASPGRETVYFNLPGDDRSRRALQVTFERNRPVTDAEFRMLKAAACLTAAVLELEKPVSSHTGPMALLNGRVA
jgi:hypothetical protein